MLPDSVIRTSPHLFCFPPPVIPTSNQITELAMIPNPATYRYSDPPLLEIVEEGYQVRRTTTDPRTGLTRDPVWVPRSQVNSEVIARWEAKKRADPVKNEAKSQSAAASAASSAFSSQKP